MGFTCVDWLAIQAVPLPTLLARLIRLPVALVTGRPPICLIGNELTLSASSTAIWLGAQKLPRPIRIMRSPGTARDNTIRVRDHN